MSLLSFICLISFFVLLFFQFINFITSSIFLLVNQIVEFQFEIKKIYRITSFCIKLGKELKYSIKKYFQSNFSKKFFTSKSSKSFISSK